MNKEKFFIYGFMALIIVCLPLVTYFFHFSGDLSNSNADWGDFGSYVGGTLGALFSGLGFVILAVTLFITITHNYAERENSKEANELAKASYQAQIIHQRNEFNLQLINSYIDALNTQINQRTFSKPGINNNEEFLDQALHQLERYVKTNPNSDIFTLASCALDTLHVRYDNELSTLYSIEKIIIEEKDEEIRHHFRSQLSSKVNPENLFWIQMHLCLCCKGYKEKILEHRFFNPSVRLLDAFPEHYKKRAE